MLSAPTKLIGALDWLGACNTCAVSCSDADETRDAIFERALTPIGRRDDRLNEADRLLSAMLLFDSVAYSEHVLEALDCHTDTERERALDGFRFFGLGDIADLVESIADRVRRPPSLSVEREAFEDRLIGEYEAACPVLTVDRAFETHFALRPQDFAPLSEQDVAQRQDTIGFIRRL
jgi:hypothetical protein